MSKRQGGKVKPVKGGGGKSATAKKQQAVVDKTFGMKNKKGKAAQKVVQTYQSAGKSKEDKKKELEREQKKKAKEEKEKLEAERAILFKKVEVKQKPQTAPPGVDPKSIVCINFKSGHCSLGDACPFSHDLAVERKSEKRDLFVDQRELENDTINTAGICKYFLKAIEDQKVGWNWKCPSGEKCPYRHALPQGFVIKKNIDEKVVERPIEDILEEQRLALPSTGGTPVTNETFNKWKEKILKQKEVEEKKNKQARAQAIQAGKLKKTGREILQEDNNSFKEEMEEQDLDIALLLQQKKEEEEDLDRANAELVKKISAEVANSEREFDKQITELEAQGLSAADAISRIKLTSWTQTDHVRGDGDEEKVDITMSPRDDVTSGEEENGERENPQDVNNNDDDNNKKNALIGVDEGLFAHEAEEELPEFSDDE